MEKSGKILGYFIEKRVSSLVFLSFKDEWITFLSIFCRTIKRANYQTVRNIHGLLSLPRQLDLKRKT